MMKQVILTVVGSDRPGLTQAIADAVLAVGGNWLESHLATVGGKYVGSVLVELPEGNMAALQQEAARVDAAGLHVTLIEAARGTASAEPPLRLELVGQDRPGIVREVTAVLNELGVNIEDIATAVEDGAWSGAKLFRAEAHLRLPGGVDERALRDALERISGEIMVDISLSPEPGRA